MSDRKPLEMSWEGYVEHQIQRAQRAGEFEQLGRMGKRLKELEEPPEEDWWLKKKLKEENLSVLPPTLAIGLDVHRTVERLARVHDEHVVRRELAELNRRIDQANFAAWSGPPSTTARIDIDRFVAQWKVRREDERGGASDRPTFCHPSSRSVA